MMRRPEPFRSKNYARKQRAKMSKRNGNDPLARSYPIGEFIEMSQKQVHHHPFCHQKNQRPSDFVEKMNSMLSIEAIRAVEAVDYITNHLKHLNKYKKIKEEWKCKCVEKICVEFGQMIDFG